MTTSATTTCKRCRSGREHYRYMWGAYDYDVDRARELTQDGRLPVEVEEESVQASVDECTIDWNHVNHVDPSIPGLIAHIQYRDDAGQVYKGHVLIDGHHRAAACLKLGLPYFAYLLSEEESEAIILKSPNKKPRPEPVCA